MSMVLGSGKDILRTTSLPSATNFTMASWMKVTGCVGSDTTQVQAMYLANNSSNLYALNIYVSPADTINLTRLRYVVGGTGTNGTITALPSEWVYVALRCSGTGTNLFTLKVWDASLSEIRSAAITAGTAHTLTEIGWGGYSSTNSLTGYLAYGRVWDDVLSDGELLSEAGATSVVKTSTINSSFGTTEESASSWTLGGSPTWDTSGNNEPPIVTVQSGIILRHNNYVANPGITLSYTG